MNFGTALTGYGNAQPQIQALAEQQRKRDAQKQAFAALAAMAQKQQGIPALPGSKPMGMPPQATPGTPGMGAAPGGAATQAPAPNPRSDYMAMIDQVASMNMPDDQRMAALTDMGAFMAPIEKYTQQMELQQTRLQGQLDLLDERNKMLLRLQGMKDATSEVNTDKRVAATERGQDMRSKTSGDNTTERHRHNVALENKVPPENKKPFQAAKDIYDRAAALYQSLTRPGVTPPASQEDIAFAKSKMDAAQAKMESLTTSTGMPAPPTASGAPKEKIKPGEEVRYDDEGVSHVNRNGVAVPAEP